MVIFLDGDFYNIFNIRKILYQQTH